MSNVYVGIGDIARKVTDIYVGVDGVARKVMNGYVGVNGVARQFYASFTNPLNTDAPTLGDKTVYFKAYPNIKWCVDHIVGDYVYLGLYNVSETTQFGSSVSYSGSTVASKCTTYLNNTIPNVADYLENVTVNGVTAKIFIPSYKMFSGKASSGGVDASDPTFSYLSASFDNRKACIANWSRLSYFWLSSSDDSGYYVWGVYSDGSFGYYGPNYENGFRPEVKVRYKA